MLSPLRGIVVHGKQEARKLGYPTANIEHSSTDDLESGVWTCTVTWNTEHRPGLAVIGMWQQSNGKPSLEVHLLDFQGDLYNQQLSVTLHEKLHENITFTTTEALIKQIEHDVHTARLTLETL